jgi:bifunctional DNA-binding transcriptional regulator/antitoxin component of YhaV-PrlF toxin-antitoxin module
MTSKNVTITSKNQITIPAEFVRNMQLGKSRKLSVRQRGNALILKPQTADDILKSMQKHWKHQAGKRPLTDKELKQAIRDSVATAWDDKRQRGESD